MTPHRDESPLTSFPWRSALVAVLAVSLLVGLPAFTDDTNLLRFDTAKPYVFIILDTSASMGMEFDTSADTWTPGGADGPGSRLYQAKQALFNTFKDVNDVHFGFASYNQDLVRAYQKHWLYYYEGSLPDSWPIAFPLSDSDTTLDDADSSALTKLVAIELLDEDGNPIEQAKDTRELEIDGHLLTFGAPFPAEGREAGSCGEPLDLTDDTDLSKLQSFAIDGRNSPQPTRFWITDGKDDYLLEVNRPGNNDDGTVNAAVGTDKMLVKLALYDYRSNSCPFTPGSSPDYQASLQMRLDPYLSDTFFVDSTQGTITAKSDETLPRLWEHQDAVSEGEFGTRPFTGEGWESNYDSGGLVVIPADATAEEEQALQEFQAELDSSARDRWCADEAGYDANGVFDNSLCQDALTSEIKPAEETLFDADHRRSLDNGDMIPFHWSLDHRSQFLDRLAPGYSSSAQPDFRAASFFEDSPDAGSSGAPLQLVNSTRRPLLALDVSPLQRAMVDVRCWYLGLRGKGSNKCKSENPVVEVGWEERACEFDSQFGCRKPYLIIITDGEANTGGQNATASVSDMQNASGVRTWVLNLGDPKNCQSGTLHSIVQSSGKGKDATGECIDVDGGSGLRQELESILGEIRTEVKAFASAAVPTVQATVEQKIFLTNFIPFNDSGVWDGHVDAFLKPLRVDNGKPDDTFVCGKPPPDGSSPDPLNVGCFLWDAKDNLLTLQYDETAPTDELLALDQTDRRRVFYARAASEPGDWANRRELFLEPALEPGTQEQRFDLWDALGITGYNKNEPVQAEGEPHVNKSAHDLAQAVIDFVLHKKVGTEVNTTAGTTTPIDVLLGDIFHSTPQVVGTPPNLFYFARDLNGDDSLDCKAGDDNENKGYRCFFNRHRLRRKMLVVGANDGQLHAFDAGRFRGHDDPDATDSFTGLDLVNDANPDGSFDNGTGMELFSYVPRMVMPTLKEQHIATSKHFFSVDGNTTVADVFIDPVNDGGTFPTEADREWRTVVIGGLREGGVGYYALDITQPDPIETHPELGFVPTVAPSGGDSNDPASANYLPGCLTAGATDCGEVPFPVTTWEFTDRSHDNGTWYRLDEDRDWMEDPDTGFTGTVDENDPSFGQPDLADSWSTPNVGRIQICKEGGSDCGVGGADLEDRYVAVFGGGMDVDSKSDPFNEVRGNWLYMVDIETGQVLYKQRLVGAAPAEPAAVDITGDGYFDRIYIGTLAGFMYRVDLGPVSGSFPGLEVVEVTGIADDGSTESLELDRLPRDVWQPVRLFDANFDIGFNDDGSPATDDDGDVVDQDSANFRPIYYRPAVLFQADDEGFVLAFGTGDREDLWSLDDVTGRFFMLVDSFNTTADISGPLNESDLARVDPGDAGLGATNLLQTGGWYLVLGNKERVITEAFSLSGLTIFSAYEPIVFTGEDTTTGEDATTEEEQVCGEDIESVDADTVCSLRGTSNIYVVKTTNADGLLFDTSGNAQRSRQVADFVTNPFTEQGTVKRARGDGSDAEGGGSADELTPDLEKVMESLKDLFPDQCRFANYRVDVKTIAADTSLQFIAPIPVCIIEHNWKEF